MTKITTDFTGLENATTRLARMQAICDFWRGTGAFAAAGTLGNVRVSLNGLLDTAISDGEAFGSWLAKLNLLNDPDAFLSNTLSGTGPNFFPDGVGDFGPDGVTPAAVGGPISLVVDGHEGLELGPEMRGDATVQTLGSPGTLATYNPTTGEGSAFRLDGSNVSGVRLVVTDLRVYLVDITAGPSMHIRGSSLSGTILRTLPEGRSRQVVYVPAGEDLHFTMSGNNTGANFTLHSIRELTNWPAYQPTIAARPTESRAPAQVRNLASNSDLAGAVAGTPGTAPTGWAIGGGTGSIVSVAADGLLGGNSIRLAATAGRHIIARNIGSPRTNTVYEWSALAEVIVSGTVQDLIAFANVPSGSTVTYKVDGVAVAANAIVATGFRTLSAVLSVGSVTGSVDIRFGVGCGNNTTADVRFWAPQFEIASARTAYQRRGPNPTDITEAGVPSLPLQSFDGSDDALLHQLAAGGTVGVSIFGRGMSWNIPSITLSAPSVLQLGPLAVLDDGVLVAGCPPDVFRACGFVPWSSRFEIVRCVIHKPNLSATERARLMRRYAALGAAGWAVEGPEQVANGGFDSDTVWTKGAGWSIGGGVATKTPGVADSLEQPQTIVPGGVYRWSVAATVAAGSILVRFSPNAVSGPSITSTGTHTGFLIGGINTTLAIAATATFDGTVDNVSLKRFTPEAI